MPAAKELFPLFLASVPTSEWTVAGGGTTLEAIGKETQWPTEPSRAKSLEETVATRKFTCKLRLSKGAEERLGQGWKVYYFDVRVYAKVNLAAGKDLKVTLGGLGNFNFEPEVTVGGSWLIMELTEAQAREQSTVSLTAMVVTVEKLLVKKVNVYEVYCVVGLEKDGEGPKPLVVSRQSTLAATR